MFQLRQIWLFCNVYSRKMVDSLGLQFKEPKTCNIQLKNHIEVDLCKKKTVTKRTSHSKNVKCLKSSKSGLFYKGHFSFLFCFVFFYICLTKTLCKFLQIDCFWHFWKWSHCSNISCVLNLLCFFPWNKTKLVVRSLKRLLRPLSNL